MGTSEPQITEVPDVVGLEALQACELVRAAGLVPYGPEYLPAPESGVITGQAPVGNAGAERGAPVFLLTGRGGQRAEPVPPPHDRSETLTPV